MPQDVQIGQTADYGTEAVVEPRRFGGVPPPPLSELPFGPDDDGRTEPVISNTRLAMLLFLAFEAMFFAGMIGAFLVFRVGSTVWPPPGQPTLPVAVTGVNTAVLLFSGYTMRRAFHKILADNRQGLIRWLLITTLLGSIFLVVQGYEWVRLLNFGLTLASGAYGFTFYTLVGLHGAHVFGAVLWLLLILLWAKKDRFSAIRHTGVDLCRMYWYFVVALWPVLYTLVYLHWLP